MSINLDKPYDQALKSSRPIVAQKITQGKYGISKVPVTIPPLNTNIAFRGTLPVFKRPPASRYKFSAPAQLPETWNWRYPHPSDSSTMKTKKKIFTQPQNQNKCGSCWAIATAGAVSDVYVVTKGFNPEISTTYSLACYPQWQCGGGMPTDLLLDIQKNGVSTDRCIDYSWCLTDENCSGDGATHFDAARLTEALNSAIPRCGCYTPNNHFLYFVKNSSVVLLDDTPDAVNIVKSHIYNHGPVIGGYHVYSNFFSGDFTKSKGVYLEYVDYASSLKYFASPSPQWSGSHAVVIIGWGVEKDVTIMDDNGKEAVADVPYWYVRNSWSANWGADGGYFKIAMYPFNRLAQFEKMVIVSTPGGRAQTGGIITFQCGDIKPGNFNKIGGKGVMDEEYYQKDIPIGTTDDTDDTKPQPNTKKGLLQNIIDNLIDKIIFIFK